jgi:hypothetical protein
MRYFKGNKSKIMEAHTNWLALAVAALATQIIGFIWYHPKVFGNTWMASTGITEDRARTSNLPLTIIISLVLMFAVAYELKYVAHGGAEFTTFKHGAYHAMMDGLLLVIPIVGILTRYEQKGFKYFTITAGYWLLCFVVMGGIISWWR